MRDECFIRGEIPMTKSEVRAVSISKLELEAGDILYDVGAGTGSVSVEAARLLPEGHVYAFEQKEEGCQLIQSNMEKFHVENISIIKGRAPETMTGVPVPDKAFLGGTNGGMEGVLDTLFALNPGIRIVINVIALESLSGVMAYFERKRIFPEVVCMQVSRSVKKGRYHLMQGQNPVYVITVQGNGEKNIEKIDDVEAAKGEAAAVQVSQKKNNLPRVMIAAPASGSGKTTITTGLLEILRRRGISCAAFKCGPDYIDPLFHQYVQGVPGYNLDSFFLSEKELRELMRKKTEQKEFALIEGVMGYYDGLAGNSTRASSYDIARITETPVILVLNGKKSSLSLVAEVKGFQSYRPDSRIAGVILNQTSGVMAERLRAELETLGVACLGAVPDCGEARLESRHLGLTLPEEQKNLREQIGQLADRLEQCLDLARLLEIAKAAPLLWQDVEERQSGEGARNGAVVPGKAAARGGNVAGSGAVARGRAMVPGRKASRRIGVAMDEAFCFYYQDNLDFLKEAGWTVVPFSPLHDQKLPEQLDALLLGGGYPELYAKELSENAAMREEISGAYRSGVRILAECGGFLYLNQSLEGKDGVVYPMVGLIAGEGFATGKLSRFGYIELEGAEGSIRGHEFHYWDSTAPGTDMQARKPGTNRSWSCMHVTDRLAAGFPHLYYRSSPEWVRKFLEGRD